MTVAITPLARRGDASPAQNLTSDNFNRANSAVTAGSTNDYAGGNSQAWVPTVGSTWGISGGKLYCPLGAADDYLTVPATAYADVRATIVSLPLNSTAGLVAGFADSNNFVVAQIAATGALAVYKRVAGTFTQLGSLLPQGTFQGGELRLRLRPGAGSNTLVDVIANGILLETLNNALGFALGASVGFRQDKAGAGSGFLWRDFQVAKAHYSVPLPPSLARYGIVLAPAGLEEEILNPTAFWDVASAKWWMNYSSDDGTGHTDGSQLSSSMASATSLYGPWTRSPNNPVLVPGAGEGGYSTDGSITKLGSTYFFYYQDFSANTRYATASAVDGPYTKQGPIANLAQLADCFTRMVGSTMEFWAEGPPGAFGAGFGTTQGIYYSTSTDGVTWSAPTLAFLCPWQSGAGAPNVYNDANGGLHCFFCAAVNGSGGILGRVTHEAVSPSGSPSGPWTQRPVRLNFGAAGAFDSGGVFDAQPILASPDGTSPVGNQLFVLYSGSQLSGGIAGLAASAGLAIGPDWPA